MNLRIFLLCFFSFNICSNDNIQNINKFLDAERFSYEHITENSNEIVLGKLILNPLQTYLEILSPYRESYLISKNFITYNDIDFSQQRTFQYLKDDYPIINIISNKKIPEDDSSLYILTLENSVYVTDKLTKQMFKFSLNEDEILLIQFIDNFGIENSIFLKRMI